MIEERRKVLEMLKDGKITLDEATALLDALGTESATTQATLLDDIQTPKTYAKEKKFLCINVQEGEDDENGENVNIRVPLKLIRAGVKLGALLPKDKQAFINAKLSSNGVGFNLNDLGNSKQLEDVLDSLSDLEIDVNKNNGKNERVRIFAE